MYIQYIKHINIYDVIFEMDEHVLLMYMANIETPCPLSLKRPKGLK